MWGNFTFNIGFSYHWGGKLYNSTLRNRVEVTNATIAAKNVDERVLSDRWKKPGDNTFFKGFGSGSTHATSRYVLSDNVLELSSVSAQYRWNTEWLRNNLRLESIVFALNANSLFYWSSVKYERGT
ncbi:SusC/RagA family TonB-linked outer membrane protein, partial [Parabacteroides distasonis]